MARDEMRAALARFDATTRVADFDDQGASVAAALRQLLEETEWRDIDDFAASGEWVWVYFPYWHRLPFKARYAGHTHGWEGEPILSNQGEPEAYMPLPAPPKGGATMKLADIRCETCPHWREANPVNGRRNGDCLIDGPFLLPNNTWADFGCKHHPLWQQALEEEKRKEGENDETTGH